MIKILHTADWHLGQTFHEQRRTEEHQAFLNWLLLAVQEHQVDVLVVAGDIFDTANPSNESQSAYYQFITKLTQTCCQHCVIVAGNHDSGARLEVARPLLQVMDVHVIGTPRLHDLSQQLLALSNKQGEPMLLVSAIPYLRDNEMRQMLAGQTFESHQDALIQAMYGHYQSLWELTAQHPWYGQVPTLATGHLFAQGASLPQRGERAEKDIHVGNLGQLPVQMLDLGWDYVALGHIHRAQEVGGRPHVRYSGSPIPLSFAERDTPKQVQLVELQVGQPAVVTPINVPQQRSLLRLEGTRDELVQAIENLPARYAPELLQSMWVELRLNERLGPGVIQQNLVQPLEALGPRVLRQTLHLPHTPHQADEQQAVVLSIHEYSPEQMFEAKCNADGLNEEEVARIVPLFALTLEAMQEDSIEE